MALGEPWPYTYGWNSPLALCFVSRYDMTRGDVEEILIMAREVERLKAENVRLEAENAELKARLSVEP
jgi:hypothetical protein